MMSEELIKRFFAKQCTAEEADEVAIWLKAHPEEAAAYFEYTDWKNASGSECMPDKIYVESWQQIHRKVRSRKRYSLLKYSAVAACIASCLIAGILFIKKTQTLPLSASSRSVLPSVLQLTIADTEYNLTNKPLRITLADNSVVSISPRSVVWFDTPFAQKNTRNIYLKGEARFEVAKNKLKPFTVYSGSFSTTALGTEFIVKEQPHNIRVQLMHGKVVIKNTDHSVKNWENIYLFPGQQMLYNDKDALAKVSLIQKSPSGLANKLVARTIIQRETADSLIFNGSPMSTVLQKLHSYYDVDIQFAAADIKNISFTGVIVKKDSVQNILKAITQMNDLSVESTDSSFIILKERN